MNIQRLLFLLPLTVFFLSACKQRKTLQKQDAGMKMIQVPESFSLFDSIESYRFSYHTLSAKINTSFKGNEGSDLNVMITMRAISDSAIWMSVSPALGIEAARILFTSDSIKIMDKIHGSYAMEPYTFLKRFSEADITFRMLQNILSGNAAFINHGLVTDSITQYYLAHCNEKQLFQRLIITPLFRIFGNNISDYNSGDNINLSYKDFQTIENKFLPFGIRIEVDSKGRNAEILMNYSSVKVNMPVDIKFNVPSSYTRMNY